MQRIRAARSIANHFKSLDPDTMVTECWVRRLMDRGELPVLMNGTKKLTSIEAVEDYLDSHFGGNTHD